MRIPVFAANWKMNKSLAESGQFIAALISKLGSASADIATRFELVVAPPYTHLGVLADSAVGTRIQISSQNCGVAKNGAFTGEISPSVLRELGCDWTIIGHSERRHVFKEDDGMLLLRTRAAIEEKLSIIFCIGETLEDRRAGKTMQVLGTQLKLLSQLNPGILTPLVLAYEPVWAIGTGETATPGQAQEVHAFIREWLTKNFSTEVAGSLRILYGGSVKPENAAAIMSQNDVDGLLVGGASLDPEAFSGIVIEGLKGKNL